MICFQMWMRRIMRELGTLREDLPPGIYVITYEDRYKYFTEFWVAKYRTDLLSTIIMGPRGTPYEATPFYFDIRFKSDYPCSPPEVVFQIGSSTK